MSCSSGIRPLVITGLSAIRQVTPSGLVAIDTTGVVQVCGSLLLNTAQNSWRDSIHCTSRCQGKSPSSSSVTGTGADQATPSAERRSSTVVASAPQPDTPAFTDHMSHSPG